MNNFEFTSWDFGREVFLQVNGVKKINLVILNHLAPAELNDYSHIFAKYSRIQFQLYDYNSKKSVSYNFKPEEILYLIKNIERFKTGLMLGCNIPFSFEDKRPNKKDGWNNFKLSYDSSKNYCWKIEIINNNNGENVYYQFNMDDYHFEQMLISIENLINTFLASFGGPLLIKGYNLTKGALSNQNEQLQNYQYDNNNY